MHVLFPNGNEAYWAELQATWVLQWSKKHYKQQEIIKSILHQEEIWGLNVTNVQGGTLEPMLNPPYKFANIYWEAS
jgi:hypothetical protein